MIFPWGFLRSTDFRSVILEYPGVDGNGHLHDHSHVLLQINGNGKNMSRKMEVVEYGY
jgi:hypothetical protein